MPVTPRFLLSGHLNLYLPIQNLATFTTISFTPHKHMVHYNTIPNSTTCIHLHTFTHKKTPTIATLFSLPLTTPPNGSWWYWQHDGTTQHAMKINTSRNNSTTYQHAPCHAGYFRISVNLFNGGLFWSNNIFINNLCHCMVFSIGEFPANSYTLITYGLAQASNFHILTSWSLPPGSNFFNHVPRPCTSLIAIHESYFFPYMVLNTNITFETNFYP